MPGRFVADRLRHLLGEEAVGERAGAPPTVTPADTEACALVLRRAALEGWRAGVAGAGSWLATAPDADLVISTERLGTVGPVDAPDLVATAGAGVRWAALRERLADHGMWVAQDPPGGDRTLGSALATGTSGPLRTGFGALRDQVLGLTLVTGDGRVLRVGGRVVKNVAGYDLGKLALGTFSAFGVITAVHLRLRAVPRADLTLRLSGGRDDLLAAGRRILAAHVAPAGLELLSPRAAERDTWQLAVRLVGTDAEVAADRAAVTHVLGSACETGRGPDEHRRWRRTLAAVGDFPVTLRLGADPEGLERALDLVALHLDEACAAWLAVTVSAGTVRWSGDADPHVLSRFRRAAAQLEWPVTVERAPAATLAAVGHFGAYREGVFRIVQGLRRVFDPAGVLTTPLDPA